MSSAANEAYAGSDQTGRTKTRTEAAIQDDAREMADHLREQGSAYMETARRSAEDVAERTAALGRQASNSVQEVGANFREAIERSVERQPLTTVLLAMAAGVILGGLMRR